MSSKALGKYADTLIRSCIGPIVIRSLQSTPTTVPWNPMALEQNIFIIEYNSLKSKCLRVKEDMKYLGWKISSEINCLKVRKTFNA